MEPAVRRKRISPSVVASVVQLEVVLQHRRDDARGSVGGCGDHPTTGCVLLADRHGPDVDPIQGLQWAFPARRDQLPGQTWCASRDLQRAGQGSLRPQPSLDAAIHGRPDLLAPLSDGGLALPGGFVGQCDVGNLQSRLLADGEEFGGRVEGVARPVRTLVDRPGLISSLQDEAATDGVSTPSGALLHPAHRWR